MKLTVLVDNQGPLEWKTEHGLALLLELPEGLLLFDTGAGEALPINLRRAGVETTSIRWSVISHGHYDHTGALAELLTHAPNLDLYYGEGVERVRYSLHPGRPIRELTLPPDARQALNAHPQARCHKVQGGASPAPGVFLVGPIPRRSFEDCGGPFFLDESATVPDEITDEIALLTQSGALVQGCCHAGIINTIEHCKNLHPEIQIRTIIGGLHLLHASPERLKKTADYLNTLDLDRLILLHCTGNDAVSFLKAHLTCDVHLGAVGETYLLG